MLSTIVVKRLLRDEALIEIEGVAARGGGREAGRVVSVAAEGDPSAGGVVAQCREVYGRIGKLLTAAGVGLDAVVKTTELVVPEGLGEYRKTADVRREVFVPPYPAATGVICERLMRRGALLSVEATAVIEGA